MRLFAFEGVRGMKSRLNLKPGQKGGKLKGNWARDEKLWYIRYGDIKGTELEKHIILDAYIKNRTEQSRAEQSESI